MRRRNPSDLERALAGDKNLAGADLKGANLFDADLRRADLKGADFSGADLRRADLIDADLSGANLKGAYLRDAILAGANLKGANLTRAILAGANLAGADLEDANLEDAYLTNANLEGANLSGAALQDANLTDANLTGAILRGANLEGANLEGAKLLLVNLKEADLSGANLKGANLEGATLSGANLRGVDLSDENLKGANLEGADLAGANLTRTKLPRANLTGANLTRAKLTGANLRGANLSGAYLVGATFLAANISGASLSGANLSGAYLVGANLEDADLEGANLEGANLFDANVEGTILGKPMKPVATRPARSFGRQTGAVLKMGKPDAPTRAADFKRRYPAETERLKGDTQGRDFSEPLRATVRQKYATPFEWLVTEGTYDSDIQRLCPDPNLVYKFNLDLTDPTFTERQRAFLKRLAEISRKSGHPYEKKNLFTVGWVRLCVNDAAETWLVEEIQSDVGIVRTKLKDGSAPPAGLEGYEDVLQELRPYIDRFYEDALGIVFMEAETKGYGVEMLEYEAKREFKSPRAVYTDLPRSMGMQKRPKSAVLGEAVAETWFYKPNPRRGRR